METREAKLIDAKAEKSYKQCKQCGRYLPEAHFRKNPSRSTGKRKTTTGYSTICIDCFNYNQLVDRAYKAMLSGAATPKQLEMLDKTEVFFKSQIAKGFEPMGLFARKLKGQSEQKRRSETTFEDYMQRLGVAAPDSDQFVDELQDCLRKATVEGYLDDDIWGSLEDRYDPKNPQHQELMNAIEDIRDKHDEYERAKFAGIKGTQDS